jgi:hypothetical protein
VSHALNVSTLFTPWFSTSNSSFAFCTTALNMILWQMQTLLWRMDEANVKDWTAIGPNNVWDCHCVKGHVFSQRVALHIMRVLVAVYNMRIYAVTLHSHGTEFEMKARRLFYQHSVARRTTRRTNESSPLSLCYKHILVHACSLFILC